MSGEENGKMPKGLPLRLEETRDGSHTLVRTDLDESYHSYRGARSESVHVFIERGLDFVAQRASHAVLTVFEVGFGTGLNALLSWEYAKSHQSEVSYHTLEPYPVPFDFVQQLNYADEDQLAVFREMHESPWGDESAFGLHFYLTKYKVRLEDFQEDLAADVVYMDAFAPSKQAEVWYLPNLSRCFDLLASGGVLVTYCAQGQFKRDLKTAGFEVEVLQGALGKKEMVRAHKP
ncbi:MAG: tRNA (5-methylaminomethyl-2-thiouridine)(34)-methyltransferase MnmD [Bacteroidota bacterium]